MENNGVGNNEQFLTEVFPAELKEIKKRRVELKNGANEPIQKVIDTCGQYQKVHEEY